MKWILYLVMFISFTVGAYLLAPKSAEEGLVAKLTYLESIEEKALINEAGQNLLDRFPAPDNYERVTGEAGSYPAFLRALPLKPAGSQVMTFNGGVKPNNNVYDAVVDLPIGSKDLHQCADAVMRLRAEYLWSIGAYDKIHFNFTNGFNVAYSEWMKGKRIVVSGNKVSWAQKAAPSNTKDDLWNYLEQVFMYAGTLSLSRELDLVERGNIQIGDVFIWGGSPGHAVMVVDMIEHKDTKRKLFMLAQSFMPAQEIQVLKNPNNYPMSPWYSEDYGDLIITPEWTFKAEALMRFPN